MDAQGRALEALREGAQGMQKQMGQGQGRVATARADIPRAASRPGDRAGDDPLGRGREGDPAATEGSLREPAA